MTIYDISRLAGVSIATVSRVLNGSPNVRPETKQKILDCIEQSGYTPNAFARGLGLNTMKTVGILCADSSDIYLSKAVYYIEQALRIQGYNCLLCCTGYEWENKHASMELLLNRRVDSIVLTGSNFVSSEEKDNRYIRDAAAQVPVMLLNAAYSCPGVYCTLCDDLGSTQAAAGALICEGITDILFLYNSQSYSALKKRTGYQAAFLEHDLPVSGEYIRFFEGDTEDIDGVCRYLSSVSHDISFHAVLASEDFLAAGALKYAKQSSLRVPEDLSVIGYNNSILARCCEPELSSVDNHLECLCKTLTETLVGVLGGDDMPAQTMFPGELILRGSTRIKRNCADREQAGKLRQ